jgi:hypothetical protein
MPVYDTDEGMQLLQDLAARRGLSAAALVRQLVREEAERVALPVRPVPTPPNADRAASVNAAFGAFADLPTRVDDYLREKHAEATHEEERVGRRGNAGTP